ncbi:MAG: hypothetical protein ACLR2O_05600 [Coprococcus sp.]
MLWQIIFLAAGILSLIYYGAICIALKKWDSTFSRFWLVCGSIGIAGSVLIRFIWNAVDSRIADRYHGVPSFACRDEDHNRNVRRNLWKKERREPVEDGSLYWEHR